MCVFMYAHMPVCMPIFVCDYVVVFLCGCLRVLLEHLSYTSQDSKGAFSFRTKKSREISKGKERGEPSR